MPMTPPENRMSHKNSDNRKGRQPDMASDIVGSSSSDGVRFKMPSGSSPMTGGGESHPLGSKESGTA